LGHSILFLAIALPVCLSIVVLSAGYFVKGAVAIAHRLSVPEFIVGSVIVAIGTSAPEVAINISAVIEGAGDIVISNIVGSNIVNIGLGIGVAGLILRFGQARPEYIRTIFIGLAGAIALLANTLISGTSGSLSTLGFPFALALLAAFAYFMYTSIRNSDSSQDEHFDSNVPLFLAIGFVVGGTIAMAFFSNLAVEYAVALSQRMAFQKPSSAPQSLLLVAACQRCRRVLQRRASSGPTSFWVTLQAARYLISWEYLAFRVRCAHSTIPRLWPLISLC
jgi:cation:H+ antiporter